MLDDRSISIMTESMALLNRMAADLASDLDISACTDVTGFGLVGHAFEMIAGTGLGLVIHTDQLPLLPDVEKWATTGTLPGGLLRNQCYRINQVDLRPDLPEHLQDVVFDPQTSGGLLIGLPANRAEELARRLLENGLTAAVIGEVVTEPAGRIQLL